MPQRLFDAFIAITQVVLFALLAILIVPARFILQPLLFLLFIPGLVVFVLGYFNLGLRSYSLFSTPRSDAVFVPQGVFRYIRHPIYSGVLLMGLAFTLSRPVLPMILLYTLFAAITFLRVYLEERFLRQKYPQYADYMRSTKRFIPYLF